MSFSLEFLTPFRKPFVALAFAVTALTGRAEPVTDPELTPATDIVTSNPEEASAPTPPTAPPLDEKQQILSSCSLPKESEFFGFEWARRTSFRSVCLASHWIDGMFGENEFDPKEGEVNGYIALNSERRSHEQSETLPTIRVSLRLPQASKKFDLFFDRDLERQSIAGESAALRPESRTETDARTNQLGIGYQLYQGVVDLLNVRIGARVRSLRPELFARSRYAATLADSGTDRWHFEQTLFWIKDDGFGEFTGLEYQRHLGGPFALHWQNGASYAEATRGVRWSSAISLFHAIDNDRGIQWSYGANGETGLPTPLANHGPRISYRQRAKQRWLIFETYLGLDYPKDEVQTVRQSQAYIGARIEAHFNPPK